MHKIKANGGYVTIYHQRTWDEIKRKPHICIQLVRTEFDSTPTPIWAVYYLRGKQSRIRCNLYMGLKDAIKQVSSFMFMGAKP